MSRLRAESVPSRRRAALDSRVYDRSVTLLAHTGDTALEGIVVGSIVVPLAILAALCWFVFKASRATSRKGRAAVLLTRAAAAVGILREDLD